MSLFFLFSFRDDLFDKVIHPAKIAVDNIKFM